ncbi:MULTISPECIES: nitrate reductase molybdenum cofactor assembly chaperone [Hydrogenophaga]|jgi:nitrate reductase delta subunit|uniref:Nitrate reductase molybdenum cofactor assembly chaperone NarJ n=1 Tax=Hydrogenophaga pseudoflava TaxID=47421 RepID=A0A4P6WT63_HYDPS|nr:MULTISPECIES: nitrate reductase molybdenum cofactor assembly chaperone [Hydrogenophaga]OPF65058.1 nitrate reductase molybdenum cofactor assembly chaperone [Hydrogenophaga sp. H7]QBM26510.1 Nitrate reductase molybdenum cofactor assembly chaperone NarJ [Hydrogenophaga pseudoflava]
MKNTRYSLRALARLLAYPDAQLRSELAPLIAAIDEEAAVPAARRAELRALAADLVRRDPLEVEARYVETFDRGRATSLHLFEHVHGDSRDRGPAMIDLVQTYEKAGLYLGPEELPDHLGVVLEFASTQPPALAKAFLGEVAHILNAIFSALLKRESPYAAVVAAVLELAGQKAEAVPFKADEALDEAWAEPEAFDGCATRGQNRPGQAQPIHIVRQKSNASQGVAA